MEKTGVLATNDPDALFSLNADCVCYNPLVPDLDELEKILNSGLNIVSTSGFITGRNMGEGVFERLDEAGKRGNASVFSGGINPGFMNFLPLALTAMCDRVHSISITESADVRDYASPGTWEMLGWGQPLGTDGQQLYVQALNPFFCDGLDLMADALCITLEDHQSEVDFAVATQDIELPYMKLPKGTVAGQKTTWKGIINGQPAITISVAWKMGENLEPNWPLDEGYLIEIEGEPTLRTLIEFSQPSLPGMSREKHLMGLGMVATAMPIVNAIPAVCEAPPGLRTYIDLPLICAARSFYTG